MIPLCGGNIDSTVLGRCIDRGLAADGRLCRFIVTVSDRPGGIAELTRLLASLGARYASSCLLKSISQVAYEKLLFNLSTKFTANATFTLQIFITA